MVYRVRLKSKHYFQFTARIKNNNPDTGYEENMKLFAIIEEQGKHVIAILIREALMHAAETEGIDMNAGIHAGGSAISVPVAGTPADILLFVSARNETARQEELAAKFGGKVVTATVDQVFDSARAILKKLPLADTAHANETSLAAKTATRRIIAVTSCPTGIAHTFMAAEALNNGAAQLGIDMRVETQGSVGAGTPLTDQEIRDADLVIIAADREVDRSRFNGKHVYTSGTKAAINNGKAFIEEAIKQARLQNTENKSAMTANSPASSKENRGGPYRHLMTGVSFMLPFVVAGGLLIAISFALGGVDVTRAQGTFAHTLFKIGAEGAFTLMVPALAGYIAFSIADRPGIAPGMIGGLLAQQLGAGFLGGIVAGFLAGYVTVAATRYIRLPHNLQGLMPVLILPLVGTAITALLMVYVMGPPVAGLLAFLTQWLQSLQGANAVFLGLLIGGMMAVDMGGPINKAAYAFSVALISSGIYTPMAAAMLGGMVPPIALAIATLVFPSRFTEEERNSKGATFILGLAFISEGAIPFAARDPLRVIPCLVIGSAVAGAIAMITRTALRVPHGGIFILPIPGAVINYGGYAAAILGGVLVSTLCLSLFRRSPLHRK